MYGFRSRSRLISILLKTYRMTSRELCTRDLFAVWNKVAKSRCAKQNKKSPLTEGWAYLRNQTKQNKTIKLCFSLEFCWLLYHFKGGKRFNTIYHGFSLYITKTCSSNWSVLTYLVLFFLNSKMIRSVWSFSYTTPWTWAVTIDTRTHIFITYLSC